KHHAQSHRRVLRVARRMVRRPCRTRIEWPRLSTEVAIHATVLVLDERVLVTQRRQHPAARPWVWADGPDLRPVLRDHRFLGARDHGAQRPWFLRPVSILRVRGAQLVRAGTTAAHLREHARLYALRRTNGRVAGLCGGWCGVVSHDHPKGTRSRRRSARGRTAIGP